MTDLLTPTELSQERVKGLMHVFAQADTTLAGRDVRCEVTSKPYVPAPSWTDGKTITFNLPHINLDGTIDDAVLVNGLNYHELMHVLCTPGAYSPMWSALQSSKVSGVMDAYNILEDQRGERVLVAMYPSTKAYFVATVARQLLNKPDEINMKHPLVHGRRYLPTKVREMVRDTFVGSKSITKKIEAVIDEYLDLDPMDDADVPRCAVLVETFAQLVQQLPSVPSQQCNTPSSHISSSGESNQSPNPSQEQKDKADEPYQGGGESQDGSDNDESAKGDGDPAGGDDESDGDGNGSGSASDGETGDNGEPGSQSEPGEGGGAGSGEGSDSDNIGDVLKDVLKDVASDGRVNEDIRNADHQVRRVGGTKESNLRRSQYAESKPLVEGYMPVAKRMAKHFDVLRHDLDPGWTRGVSSGRLNIGRAVRGDDFDTVWDRWEEGNTEAMDMEAVILVDKSGSMSGMMQRVMSATWAIASALQAVDADVSIFGFDTRGTELYRRGERLAPNKVRHVVASGGTDPTDSLDEARRLLHYSERRVKYVFIVTDGDWVDYTETTKAIKRMTDAGVITSVVGLGYDVVYVDEQLRAGYRGYDTEAGFGANFVVNAHQPEDLPPFIRQVVTATARRLSQVRR